MSNYVQVGTIKVSEVLYNFINQEALPHAEVDVEQFWIDFEKLVIKFTPENERLLEKRAQLQRQISKWHQQNKVLHMDAYKTFLEEIGYLEPVVADFKVHVENVDEEIASIAGPQLVVPINNPRYAIHAANSRWGSLYDALYGTDMIREEEGASKTGIYNRLRGDKVITKSKSFLDVSVPLAKGKYEDITTFVVQNGKLVITLQDGSSTTLRQQGKFIGFQGEETSPTSILLKNNGLHIDIQIDATHPIGKTDPAYIKDVVIESAITSIMDCEDSVVAVDAGDKVDIYRNWKGLIRGELSTKFKKGKQTIHRTFNQDRAYNTPTGDTLTLSGRVLMLVRNVGHLMTNNAVLLPDESEIYEGILDGVCTSLIAKQNLLGKGGYINSKEGSVYIVKPKMHGSEEVAFTNELFAEIENMLGLKRNTLKIGIMDEERRTSLNLKNCIYKAKERAIFINTGWLDRTGDEIHTSMAYGPVKRTADMRGMNWFQSYEVNNVAIGLQAGFQHHAQIGKGMWPKPDKMLEMSKEKINHVKAGATTAWVPSPTAATLHALHYHEVEVREIQDQLQQQGEVADYREAILEIPLASNPNWSKEEIYAELENNAQKMLGYVVRWVEQGIGCSKVPDMNQVGMMEDRATLRISSQLIANWMYHGICTEEEILDVLHRMAKVVDEQNAGDRSYRNMAPNFDNSVAFQAACDLVFKGKEQPNGYTEPILHEHRLAFKEKERITN